MWPKNLRSNFDSSGADRSSPEHFKSSYCFRQSPFSTICLEHATDTLLFHFYASASGKESTVLTLHMTVKTRHGHYADCSEHVLPAYLPKAFHWQVYDVSESSELADS